MGANYDIIAANEWIDLIDGGGYGFPVFEWTYPDNKLVTKVKGFGGCVYLPNNANFLSSITIDWLIENHALSGRYNGVNYTVQDHGVSIIRIPYESHYIDFKFYGVMDWRNTNVLLGAGAGFYDETGRQIGTVTSTGELPILLRESSEKCYFWLAVKEDYAYSTTTPSRVSIYGGLGGVKVNDQTDIVSFDDLMLYMNDETPTAPNRCIPFCLLEINEAQSFDGQTLTPTGIPVAADSEEGGGDGDFDADSDTIDFSILPVLSAVNTGLLTMWNPTVGEVMNLSNYLWSNDVFDTIKKFISSPMELIVSLAVLPVAVPTEDTYSHICIGGIDTGVTSHKVSSQYITFDCGTIDVTEYYGSALDYGSYTRLSIYLPYIGVRELKSDEIMGGAVQVKYNIDVLTGTCIAEIKCTRNRLSSVLYSFEGNMSAQLPLTSRDFSSIYTAIARGVIETTTGTVNPLSMATNAQSALSVMSCKPTMARSGSISGNGGHLGLHTPYLIIERAIQSLPKNFNHYMGSPSNITALLSSLSGYTEVEQLIQVNIHCTDTEFDEINALLKEGVYL